MNKEVSYAKGRNICEVIIQDESFSLENSGENDIMLVKNIFVKRLNASK